LTDEVLTGGTLAVALAVASCSGETLRWTNDGIWGLTENQAQNGWVRRGTANDARPLELTAQDLVSRARSAEAHDAARLGNLDVLVWTEAEEPSDAPPRRVLFGLVFDADKSIVIAGPIRLAEDAAGTQFWRYQPRLIVTVDRVVLLYVVGGSLWGRRLEKTDPSAWAAPVLLADDVAQRYNTRYPFEFDAVLTANNTIRVVYTATEEGGQTVQAVNNPNNNPAPTVDVAPDTTFSGVVDLVVTASTELALARTAVALPAAVDPTVERSAWAFTGTVAAKITEDSSITGPTVPVGPDVPARYPTLARTTYRFDGLVDATLWQAPAILDYEDTPSTMTLNTAGLINTFGEVWGVLEVVCTSKVIIDVGPPLVYRWTFQAIGPGGFADTWTEDGELFEGTTRAFPGLGYSFDIAAGVVGGTDKWRWTLYPLQANISLNGGPASHNSPGQGPFFMYGPGGPLPIAIYDGYENQGLTLTFPAGQGPNYTTTETYRFDVQSGTVAYSVNAGPYGAAQRIYFSTTGQPLIHEPAAGVRFTWHGAVPNNYTANDVWTLTAPTGQFTYELNEDEPSTALPILGADGQPLTTALTVLPYPGAPLGIEVTWPANLEIPATEAWRAYVTSQARLVMLSVYPSTGPAAITGPIEEFFLDGAEPPILSVAPEGLRLSGDFRIGIEAPYAEGADARYTLIPAGTNSPIVFVPADIGPAPLVIRSAMETDSGLRAILQDGEPYQEGDYAIWTLTPAELAVLGRTDLGTPVLEGLALAHQGDNVVLLTYRDITSSTLEARTYGLTHSPVMGPLVLGTAINSRAAQGLYHTDLRQTGSTAWTALFEPLAQWPMERVAFTTTPPGSGVSGPEPAFRGLRLLTRSFVLDGRTMVGLVYLPRYGGPDADEPGVQPVALVADHGTEEVLARVLPLEAAPLTSATLPQVLVTGVKASVILPRRGRVTVDVGESVADITPSLLTRVALEPADPAELGQLGENGTLHLGGGLPLYYDGAALTEDGFHVGPEGVLVAMAGSGGALSAGAYSYVWVYEWTDARGRRHQSAPSPAAQAVAVDSDTAALSVPLYHGTRKRGVRLVGYRTVANGTIHYRLTPGAGVFVQPDNLTADAVAYLDGQADEDILDNETLYTAGGELPHLAPPAYRAI